MQTQQKKGGDWMRSVGGRNDLYLVGYNGDEAKSLLLAPTECVQRRVGRRIYFSCSRVCTWKAACGCTFIQTHTTAPTHTLRRKSLQQLAQDVKSLQWSSHDLTTSYRHESFHCNTDWIYSVYNIDIVYWSTDTGFSIFHYSMQSTIWFTCYLSH